MGDIVASASVTGKLGAISIGNDIARVVVEVADVKHQILLIHFS
jgi:hypothetical protein